MPDSIEKLIASYPRKRPSLPEGQQAIYEKEYIINRCGKTGATRLAAKLEAWMHRSVAGAATPKNCKILEIGAGSLNHLPYERDYAQYDIVEPFTNLYAGSPNLARITSAYRDLSEIEGERYDRIISIAALEHIENLPAVLERSRRLLRPGGIFQAGIPTEGGFLWQLGWRLTTGLSYRLRTGFNYADLMRHEHLNNATEIQALVKHYFGNVSISRYPLPSFHASFYTYLSATAQ